MGKLKDFIHLLGKLLRVKVFNDEKPQSDIADIFDTAEIEIARENAKPKFIFRPRCPYRKPVKKAEPAASKPHHPKKGEHVSWRYATMHRSAFADTCAAVRTKIKGIISSAVGFVRTGVIGVLSAVRRFVKFISLRARKACACTVRAITGFARRAAICVKSTAVKLCGYVRLGVCAAISAVRNIIVFIILRARAAFARKEQVSAEAAETAETVETPASVEITEPIAISAETETTVETAIEIETETAVEAEPEIEAVELPETPADTTAEPERKPDRLAIAAAAMREKLSTALSAVRRFGKFISLRAREACAHIRDTKPLAAVTGFIGEKSRAAFNAVKSAFGKAYAAVYPIYRKVRHFIRKNVRRVRIAIGSRIIAEISVLRARKIIARKVAEATEPKSEPAADENKKFTLADSFRALFADKRLTALVELGIVGIILTSAFLTFAWFASNKDVSAKSMSVNISGTANLVISGTESEVTDCPADSIQERMHKTFTADSDAVLEPAMLDPDDNTKLRVVANTDDIVPTTGTSSSSVKFTYAEAKEGTHYIDFTTYVGVAGQKIDYTDFKVVLDADNCYAECAADETVKSGVTYYSYDDGTFTEATPTVGESAAGYFTHIFDGVYLTVSVDVLYNGAYVKTLHPSGLAKGAVECELSGSGTFDPLEPQEITLRVYFDGSMVDTGDTSGSGKTILRAGNQRVNRIFLGFDYTIVFED